MDHLPLIAAFVGPFDLMRYVVPRPVARKDEMTEDFGRRLPRRADRTVARCR